MPAIIVFATLLAIVGILMLVAGMVQYRRDLGIVGVLLCLPYTALVIHLTQDVWTRDLAPLWRLALGEMLPLLLAILGVYLAAVVLLLIPACDRAQHRRTAPKTGA